MGLRRPVFKRIILERLTLPDSFQAFDRQAFFLPQPTQYKEQMVELQKVLESCFPSRNFEYRPSSFHSTWTGEINRRTVEISCAPRGRTRYYTEDIRRRTYVGHELSFKVTTTIKGRLIIVPKQSQIPFQEKIMSLIGVVPVTGVDPSYEHLGFFSHEPTWAIQILNNSQFKAVLLERLFPAENTPQAGFILAPDELLIRKREHFRELTPELMETLLSLTLEFADLAERLPRPMKAATRTRWEIFCTKHPKSAIAVAIAIFLMVSALIPLTIIGLIVLGLGEYLKVFVLLSFGWWFFRCRKKRAKVTTTF